MTSYRVNDAGVEQARQLIDDGEYDDETDWSDGAPSTEEENELIEEKGYDAYGTWHLAIDTDASEQTKNRYGFPYGDYTTVSRAALIHAKQRASQNDHSEVEEAADELLIHLDEARS